MSDVPPTTISSPLWCYACKKIGITSGEQLNDPYPFLKEGWVCLVKWAVDEDGSGPNDMHEMAWYCPECKKLIQRPPAIKGNRPWLE